MNQQPILSHGAPIHGSQHLPIMPPDPLVGRNVDLEAVHLSLKVGAAVLLHGPAGIGKTALVAALAAGYAELPGGVLWLDVAGDTARALVTRVARAYGLDVPAFDADYSETRQTVRDVLAENRPLVVLDGDLRVEDARDFVRACASGVPVLLTHSAMAAGPWTPHEVTPLAREAAQALLLHHADGALAEDSLDLNRFLRVLGGHPLSIEVAGRQMAQGSTPDAFLERLPDLPPGQKNQAMGVLMAAYRTLPSELQGMVMLLGTAFAGGASEELLSDVSGARSEVLHKRMEDLVAYGFAGVRQVYGAPYFMVHPLVREFAQAFLRGKNRLNTMVTRHLQGLPAYIQRHADEVAPLHHDRLAAEMANIVAAGQYAAKQSKLDFLQELIAPLEATRDAGFVAARHFEPELDWLHYLHEHPQAASVGLMAEAEPEPEPEPEPVKAPEQPVTPAAPVADLPEEPSAAALEPDTEDELPGLTAAESSPAPSPEPESVAETELEDAGATPYSTDVESAVPAETGPQPAIEMSPTIEGDALSHASLTVELPSDAESLEQIGAAVARQNEPDTAIDQYEEALQSYQADGNVQDELAAIEALAKLSLNSEKYDDVLGYLDRGLTLAQEVENPQREGEMLSILGDLQRDLGRLEGAEQAYREAISAYRPVEAWLNIAITLEKLGAVYFRQRRVEDAVGVWQQSLPIFENENRPNLMRKVLNVLGDIAARQMDWAQAESYFLRALEAARALDDERAQFVQLSKLAHLMERGGKRDAAILYYRQALHFAYTVSEDDQELGSTQLALARLLVDDTVYLNRASQLLEAASDLLPQDTEIQRLLGRVKTRSQRLMRADVTLPLAEDSLQDYAAAALETPEQDEPHD